MAKNTKADEETKETLLPKGMKKDIIVIINPKPNLHLNIGKH